MRYELKAGIRDGCAISKVQVQESALCIYHTNFVKDKLYIYYINNIIEIPKVKSSMTSLIYCMKWRT